MRRRRAVTRSSALSSLGNCSATLVLLRTSLSSRSSGLLVRSIFQCSLGYTPSPNWSGHLGEVMLNLFEEEENGGISQGRRWAPAVHDRLQEGADRPRPPGRDYAFGACA